MKVQLIKIVVRVLSTYFVPKDHPIVGGYWHIGSAGPPLVSYSASGAKIVGGEWTTARLYYGNKYGGLDKGTSARFLCPMTDEITGASTTTISAAQSDTYYISEFIISDTEFAPIFNTFVYKDSELQEPLTQIANFKISGVLYPGGVSTDTVSNTWTNESVTIKRNGVTVTNLMFLSAELLITPSK